MNQNRAVLNFYRLLLEENHYIGRQFGCERLSLRLTGHELFEVDLPAQDGKGHRCQAPNFDFGVV